MLPWYIFLQTESSHLTFERGRRSKNCSVAGGNLSSCPFIKTQDCIWFPPMSRPLNNSLVIKKIFLSPVCNYTLLCWELPTEFHTQRRRPGSWAATTTPKESRQHCYGFSYSLLSPQSCWKLTWFRAGMGEVLSSLLSVILIWRHGSKGSRCFSWEVRPHWEHFWQASVICLNTTLDALCLT